MIDNAISGFFEERKEAWMKKNQKSSMSDDEVLLLQEKCAEEFALHTWLPNAAKRAGQISISTHPCTFSHPSARKNNNGYVTAIIAEVEAANDGLLRSGNVAVETDALGNAAALDVHKFLSLRMEDGRPLVMHIQEESELAKKLLFFNTSDYEVLRNGFLAMLESEEQETITSSKIKQVYFPVDGDYHQLSILSNSGLIYHLKKRIDTIRFTDEVQELREKKRKNEPSDAGFSALYNFTTIGYGGTKPQNISVLNNKNGGKAHLLHAMPPDIEARSIRFPKRDFFQESLTPWEMKEVFHALHTIFATDYNNQKIREGKYYRYQQLIDRITEKMWAVRSIAATQYFEDTSQLKRYQKIWLLDEFSQTRELEETWLEELIEEIARWIQHGYEKSIGKAFIMQGKAEYQDILDIVIQNKEVFR